MKKIIVFLLFTFCVIEGQAQELKWFTDVKEAVAIGNKEKKPLMLFFTGSDWCGWCKRLTASVFSQDEFKKWAEKNVVLLELDFTRMKQLPDEIRNQNAGLQQAFQVSGYPTVWVFDLEFDKTNYQNGKSSNSSTS